MRGYSLGIWRVSFLVTRAAFEWQGHCFFKLDAKLLKDKGVCFLRRVANGFVLYIVVFSTP